MESVANITFLQSAVMLNVFMLNAITLNVVVPRVECCYDEEML
jgi:hypothetical protein